MRARTTAVAWCLFGALAPTAGWADEPPDLDARVAAAADQVADSQECASDTGTIASCALAVAAKIQSLQPSWQAERDALEEVTAPKVEKRVADKATSTETGTAGNSPLRDALSRLITAAAIPGLSEKDGELVFGYNAPPGLLGDEMTLSLKVSAKQPEVFQPLLQAFDAEIRSQKKSAFEDRLGELDDVEAELALSRLSQRFGREFSFHRGLFQSLWNEAADRRRISPLNMAPFLVALNDLTCPDLPPEGRAEATFEELAEKCPASDIEELRQALLANITETAGAFARLVEVADERGVMEVADLVNNQPQLFLGVKHRARDGELTGPDETAIELKWEKGFRNVNALRDFCRDRGETVVAVDGSEQPALDCVHTYLFCSRSDPNDCSGATNQARKARRFSLSAEYNQVDSYGFSPEEGIDVDRDGSESIQAMLAYGWQLTTEDDGTGGNRIDFEASYEDVSDDPTKNDRLVASVTYLQQLGEEAAGSLTLIWADKPEHRGEVDEELGARVGLKWTLDTQKK